MKDFAKHIHQIINEGFDFSDKQNNVNDFNISKKQIAEYKQQMVIDVLMDFLNKIKIDTSNIHLKFFGKVNATYELYGADIADYNFIEKIRYNISVAIENLYKDQNKNHLKIIKRDSSIWNSLTNIYRQICINDCNYTKSNINCLCFANSDTLDVYCDKLLPNSNRHFFIDQIAVPKPNTNSDFYSYFFLINPKAINDIIQFNNQIINEGFDFNDANIENTDDNLHLEFQAEIIKAIIPDYVINFFKEKCPGMSLSRPPLYDLGRVNDYLIIMPEWLTNINNRIGIQIWQYIIENQPKINVIDNQLYLNAVKKIKQQMYFSGTLAKDLNKEMQTAELENPHNITFNITPDSYLIYTYYGYDNFHTNIIRCVFLIKINDPEIRNFHQ